jgi:hypothetical protein
MGRIPKVLEVCANIGIIIVSVLLTIAIVRSYFFNRPPPQNSPDNGFIELNRSPRWILTGKIVNKRSF